MIWGGTRKPEETNWQADDLPRRNAAAVDRGQKGETVGEEKISEDEVSEKSHWPGGRLPVGSRKLDEAGVSRFIPGRKGYPTRFERHIKSLQTRALPTGGQAFENYA